jgi:hypothetical protein
LYQLEEERIAEEGEQLQLDLEEHTVEEGLQLPLEEEHTVEEDQQLQ